MMTLQTGSAAIRDGSVKLSAEAQSALQQSSAAFAQLLQSSENLYSVFDECSIGQATRAFVASYMRRIGGDGGQQRTATLISRRFEFASVVRFNEEAPLLVDASEVDRVDDSALLVRFSVELTTDSRLSQSLSSTAVPLARGSQLGFANPSAFGAKENSVLQQQEREPQLRAQCAVLAERFRLPQLAHARLNHVSRSAVARLVQSQLQMSAAAATAAAAEAPAAAGAAGAAPVAPPAASAGAVGAAGAEVLPNSFVAQLWARNRIEWVAAVFAESAYRIRCTVYGPIGKGTLVERATRVCLPEARQCLLLYPKFLTPLLTTMPVADERLPAFEAWASEYQQQTAAPAAAPEQQLLQQAPVSEEQPAPERLDADSGQRRMLLSETTVSADSVENSLSAPSPRRYEPLRFFAHNLPLQELTMYEIETYARARLHWHFSRVSRQQQMERSLSGGDQDDVHGWEWDDLTRWQRLYPQWSGAVRAVLQVLGDAVRRREEHHEAIGLGILAVVAAPNEQLRDSLLFLEAGAIQARPCQTRDTADSEVLDHLTLIERFWACCPPVLYTGAAAPTLLQRVLVGIAADWRRGIVAANT